MNDPGYPMSRPSDRGTMTDTIKITDGDTVVIQAMTTLLANKNVHDITDDDIVQAGKVAVKILRHVAGPSNAVT